MEKKEMGMAGEPMFYISSANRSSGPHPSAAVGIRNLRADRADIRHDVIGRWETGDSCGQCGCTVVVAVALLRSDQGFSWRLRY